jgi:hypothetical protein|tara:strand:+ start:1015 stop:1143 length:129 start_codon:yes stop_codon:yes gene_type:complete
MELAGSRQTIEIKRLRNHPGQEDWLGEIVSLKGKSFIQALEQ